MKPLGVAEISCDDLLKQSSLEDVTVSPDLCSPAHLLTCRGNNLQTHSDSLWTADDTWTFVFYFYFGRQIIAFSFCGDQNKLPPSSQQRDGRFCSDCCFCVNHVFIHLVNLVSGSWSVSEELVYLRIKWVLSGVFVILLVLLHDAEKCGDVNLFYLLCTFQNKVTNFFTWFSRYWNTWGGNEADTIRQFNIKNTQL